jgi:hypothetical protein
MNISRKNNLHDKIILLDGVTGTGKTLFLSLMNSSDNTLAGQFVYSFEYISIMSKLGKISIDDSSTLLKLIIDEKYYNNFISREVNLRPNDLSSIFKSGKAIKYIKQLFNNDGENVDFLIKNKKPIITIVTHQLLSTFETSIAAFKDNLHIIEMERHPLYLIKHWLTWIDLYGKNPRDFTICFDYEGQQLPWFAQGWEDLFINSCSVDKVIYSLNWLQNNSKNTISIIPENQITFIPFEDFVLKPEKYMQNLMKILEIENPTTLTKALKKQNVPRLNIFQGPNKAIYRRYAFQKNMSNISHKESHLNLLKFVKDNASFKAYKLLEIMNENYENKYGIWFEN